jgi:hypothetical protein
MNQYEPTSNCKFDLQIVQIHPDHFVESCFIMQLSELFSSRITGPSFEACNPQVATSHHSAQHLRLRLPLLLLSLTKSKDIQSMSEMHHDNYQKEYTVI